MIDIDVAKSLIEKAVQRHDEIKSHQDIQEVKPSLFGTKSFCVHLKNKQGIIYCHSNNNYEGQVFYVRKGIGYYYNKKLGPSSFLGLPVSNEYECENGNKQSDFEGGYIKWLKNQDKLLIYKYVLIEEYDLST
jgi:hypothetical protein